jgi:hypothetical protein
MGTFFSNNKGPICILLLLGIPNSEYAQGYLNKGFTDPFSINVAGKSWDIGTNNINWSVGESGLTHSFAKHPTYLFTSGFLQSVYDPLMLFKSIDSFDLQIKVGPNPFNDHIYIQSKQDGIIITSVQLLDFRGDIIYHLPGMYAGIHYYQEISIQRLNNPICYLYLKYSIASLVPRTKIIKLIQH